MLRDKVRELQTQEYLHTSNFNLHFFQIFGINAKKIKTVLTISTHGPGSLYIILNRWNINSINVVTKADIVTNCTHPPPSDDQYTIQAQMNAITSTT